MLFSMLRLPHTAIDSALAADRRGEWPGSRRWINTKSSSRSAGPEHPAHRCSRILPAKTAASHKCSHCTSADVDEKDAGDPDLSHIPILNRHRQGCRFLSRNALKL